MLWLKSSTGATKTCGSATEKRERGTEQQRVSEAEKGRKKERFAERTYACHVAD